MFFDTHCHLDGHEFDVDRTVVFERATAAQVTRFLNPAYDIESSRRAVALAHQIDAVVAAVGVHPNDLATLNDETLIELQKLAQQPKVVAIGEIGLDYHWNTVTPDKQRAGVVLQLEMAQALNLPVIIHCRDAYDDILEILSAVKPHVGILLHSFAGDAAQALRALDLGYMLGISGPVTYKNAEGLRTIVAQTPINQIVLETDAPYLPPHPYRGKRNEPGFLPITADRVAALHGVSLEEVAHMTTTNAIRFFGLT